MSCLWCLGFCYKPDSLSPVSTPKNKNNLEEVKLFFYFNLYNRTNHFQFITDVPLQIMKNEEDIIIKLCQIT